MFIMIWYLTHLLNLGFAILAKNHFQVVQSIISQLLVVVLIIFVLMLAVLFLRDLNYQHITCNKFDVVVITETYLDNSIHDIHITPPGYTVFHKDRSRHGGGVLLFLRKALNGSL